MTENEKMDFVRNSHLLVSRICKNMVVYYNPDGLVFAEHNANVCENYNPYSETYMIRYEYTGLASKVCQPDSIVRIITEMPQIKRDFVKWLERPDKTDANCPVTYADVFIMDLFPCDDEEVIEDDEEEEYDEEDDEIDNYDDNPCCGVCFGGVGLTKEVVKTGIALCFGAIVETILAIDRELAKRSH